MDPSFTSFLTTVISSVLFIFGWTGIRVYDKESHPAELYVSCMCLLPGYILLLKAIVLL